MDQVKKFSIYDELLNKLRDRGCIINNASACIEVLKNIGYYRLSAYFYPFMQEDKTFVENLGEYYQGSDSTKIKKRVITYQMK